MAKQKKVIKLIRIFDDGSAEKLEGENLRDAIMQEEKANLILVIPQHLITPPEYQECWAIKWVPVSNLTIKPS